jgi:hypothetical protein
MTNLKEKRTHYLKAFKNCTPLDGQSHKEFFDMRANFYTMYKETDKLIKKRQRLAKKGWSKVKDLNIDFKI